MSKTETFYRIKCSVNILYQALVCLIISLDLNKSQDQMKFLKSNFFDICGL